ncbi:MAG: Crp/Fnr family transcriptional regulator [Pseudomonadota bacterium]|nr:Crp/Fnr family transcriptional regulator [Pseudomonadota bacterium]
MSLALDVSANRLLQRLPATERRRVESRAKSVDLLVGSVLCKAGQRMSHVYFPHRGFISLAAEAEAGTLVHLGLVGEEGMLGLPVAVEASISPLHAVVHGQGQAARVDSSGFSALLKHCPVLRHALFVYSHGLMAQISQAVVCNTLHPVPARFARWLLTVSDRLHSHTILATQEHIAKTLGVLRLSVNQAAGAFQDEGLIGYRRGVIKIQSRPGLKAKACTCYGITDKIFRAALM